MEAPNAIDKDNLSARFFLTRFLSFITRMNGLNGHPTFQETRKFCATLDFTLHHNAYMLGNSESVRLCCAFCPSDCTLMITGVVGYRFNTNKALNTVELYACQQIDNLGEWVVRYDAIGGVGKQVGLTGSAAAGDFIYVNIYSDAVGDVDGFPDFFGGSHQAIPFGTVDIGREYIQLMKHSVTVDRYGDAATTNWIYTDGWAHRKDGQLPSTTYESTQWTTGSLVGKTVHEANGEGAFPKGAYSATGQGSCSMSVLLFMHLCMLITPLQANHSTDLTSRPRPRRATRRRQGERHNSEGAPVLLFFLGILC